VREDGGEMSDDNRLPRGRQVYDAYNGARVGAIVGALLGAILAALLSPIWAVAIPVGGAAGAAAGYAWERRRIRGELADRGEAPPG
jgi:hypothetical protein